MPLSPTQPALAHSLAGPVDAPALVLVCGLGGVQAGFALQVKSFGLTHRVLTYAHRGNGGSETVDEEVTMADYVADLVALLGHVGMSRAVFVGMSFGGKVVQELAVRHPERVVGLVLAGTGGPGALPGDPSATAALKRAGSLTEDDWLTQIIPGLFGPGHRARHPGRMRSLARWRVRHPTDPIGIARQWEANLHFHAHGHGGTVRCPTMVIHGQEDALSPVENAHALAASIPGATLVVLDGVGHAPNVEAPTSFHDHIRDFLSSVGW
jgi:pimeloyl-ACP methyl ester carboxylesterase